MSIVRSSIKLFTAKSLNAALQFIGIIYFARELGAASMGTYFLYEALIGMLAIPADFGLRGSVEKRISEGTDPGEYLSSVIIAKSLPLLSIVLLTSIFWQEINSYLGGRLYIFIAIGLVLREIAFLSIFVLRGELRVGETASLHLLKQFSWLAVGIILVHNGYDELALIFGYIVGLIMMLVVGWYKCSISLSKPSIPHLKSLLDFGKYHIISSVGGYIYSWMDVAILGFFVSSSLIGAYEVAWRVTIPVLFISNSISISSFPQISQWDSKGVDSRISTLVSDSLIPSTILAIPSFFGVLLLSNEILSFTFGEQYAVASVVLIILMAEKVPQSLHKIFGRALLGIGYPDKAAVSTIVSIIANFLLNIVLINIYGIVGAAIATTVSYLLNTVLTVYFLSGHINVKIPRSEFLWMIFSSVCMYVTIKISSIYYHIGGALDMVLYIVFGAAIYAAIILLNGTFRNEFYMILKGLR